MEVLLILLRSSRSQLRLPALTSMTDSRRTYRQLPCRDTRGAGQARRFARSSRAQHYTYRICSLFYFSLYHLVSSVIYFTLGHSRLGVICTQVFGVPEKLGTHLHLFLPVMVDIHNWPPHPWLYIEVLYFSDPFPLLAILLAWLSVDSVT
jgi:hypothetical protein